MLNQINKLKNLLLTKKAVLIIFFATINALNIQSVIIGRMNVWKIFRFGYFHLINHQDLYAFYPGQYFDSYLYSPSFGVMFAPFSLLPNYLAYFLWNNISMLIIPFLIFNLKEISTNKKALICYIALIEMLTCLQGTQTNVMIAALLLIAFISFENKSYWIAAFVIAAGFYIKIYPIVAASLFLLYPGKLKFLLRLAVAFLVIGALPLIFIQPHELLGQYKNWARELVLDDNDNYGKISLTGLFQVFFNITNKGKLIMQICGALIFLLMYFRKSLFKEYYYRIFFLASMLIWVVLFNHASEIYGYAIAILGVGLWYVIQPSKKWLNIFICLFIFFATVLSIDPTPRIISRFIYEHSLKAIPFAIIYCIILYQMLFKEKSFFQTNHIFNHNLESNQNKLLADKKSR